MGPYWKAQIKNDKVNIIFKAEWSLSAVKQNIKTANDFKLILD